MSSNFMTRKPKPKLQAPPTGAIVYNCSGGSQMVNAKRIHIVWTSRGSGFWGEEIGVLDGPRQVAGDWLNGQTAFCFDNYWSALAYSLKLGRK